MKNLLFLFLMLLAHSLIAQTRQEGNQSYHQFEKDAVCYLIADKVNVRSEPSTKGAVLVNIPIGTELTILEQSSEKMRIKGFKTNWYKVQFQQNGNTQTGYIWGGLIAEGWVTSATDKKVRIMYGIASYKAEEKEYYTNYDISLQVRACKNNKELSKIEIKGDGGLSIYHWIENFGNKGLSSIDDIIEIGVSQQMCAGINAYNVIFWDGKDLKFAEQLRPGGDAPMFASDELIFPNDKGGVKGKIIRDQQVGELTDEGKEIIESHSRIAYEWTGNKLKQTKVLIDKGGD